MLLQQFKNPANPEIHFKTTGPEIWNDTKGNVDVLVAGIGTGGTITGISRYFKLEKKKKILSVGVEPESSPVITQTRAGDPVRPGPTGIQGIGAGFIPDTLDLKMLDRVELASDEESIVDGAAPGARGRDSFRHLLRSGRGGCGADRPGTGDEGQDLRGHPAGLRREVS